MTVTLNDMRDRLVPLDSVFTLLSATEPLSSEPISEGSKIHFTLQDGWNESIEETQGTDTVNVTMRVNGTERPMTKDAVLLAASEVGLSTAYVRRTPGNLIQTHLNYWYGAGMGEKEYNVLSVDDTVSAFVRPSLVPFSNVNLLESAIEGIRSRYGADTEILADYKILHSLQQTDIRLIIPEQARTMSDTNMRDVPTGEADLWSAGVHLSNSLVGKSKTSVDAYLFRWWCTNGATTTMTDVGAWNRRLDGQDQDVYEWARESVDDVLGGMEGRFAEVQALAALNVSGNTADILRDIFTQYEVPVSQRGDIMDSLLESETLTMYSIMNAITQVANTPGLDPKRADRMMRIGGSIPTATFDTLKAQVWAEGHQAEPTSANPYLITAS